MSVDGEVIYVAAAGVTPFSVDLPADFATRIAMVLAETDRVYPDYVAYQGEIPIESLEAMAEWLSHPPPPGDIKALTWVHKDSADVDSIPTFPAAEVFVHSVPTYDRESDEFTHHLAFGVSLASITAARRREFVPSLDGLLDCFDTYWIEDGGSCLSSVATSIMDADLELEFVVAGWCPPATGVAMKDRTDAPWLAGPRSHLIDETYFRRTEGRATYFDLPVGSSPPVDLLVRLFIGWDEWALRLEQLSTGAHSLDDSITDLLRANADINQIAKALANHGLDHQTVKNGLLKATAWRQTERAEHAAVVNHAVEQAFTSS